MKKQPKAKTSCGSIMVQPYPTVAESSGWRNSKVESDMEAVNALVHAARSTRASLGLAKKKCDMFVVSSDLKTLQVARDNAGDIATLALANKVTALEKENSETNGCYASVVDAHTTLLLAIDGLVDLGGELLKIEKQHEKLQKLQEALVEKTQGSAYAAKTSDAVKQEHAEKLRTQGAQLAAFEESMARLRAVMKPEHYTSYEKLKGEQAAEAARVAEAKAKSKEDTKKKQDEGKKEKPKDSKDKGSKPAQGGFAASLAAIEALISLVKK